VVISDEEIVELILFPVVNEACRVLEEGVVSKASDLDIASVMGMGFPPYRYFCLILITVVRFCQEYMPKVRTYLDSTSMVIYL
jgi:3-hydroxyacyl-CoA dehydrogenase